MTSLKIQLVAPNYRARIQECHQREKEKWKAQLSVLIVRQVRVWVDDKPRGFQPKIKIIDFQRPNLTVGIFVFDAECCKWSQGLPGVRWRIVKRGLQIRVRSKAASLYKLYVTTWKKRGARCSRSKLCGARERYRLVDVGISCGFLLFPAVSLCWDKL